MKFLSLYEGKQIGSVYSAAMTFTVQEPFNEQHFGHVGTLHQWRVRTTFRTRRKIQTSRVGHVT